MTESLFASFANAFCEALSFKLMEILVSALHPQSQRAVAAHSCPPAEAHPALTTVC